MAVTTGHGATLSFAQSGTLSLVRSVAPVEYSGPTPDISHLQTNIWREYLPPDLYELRPFVVVALADNTFTENATPNVAEVLTITLGLGPGEVAAATLVGSAVYTRVHQLGALGSNQENLRELEIMFLSHPTWTAATTS